MATARDIDLAVRQFTAETARRDRLFRAAYLFGSRARGEARPDSDVDVAVVLGGRRGDFLAAKLALAEIAYDIMLDTGILIQPLPLWEEEWEHPESHPNPRLVRNIRSEGVPV